MSSLKHALLGSCPRVTVIVPARDAAGFLEECLRAVVAQLSEFPESELILVDDGSNDQTALIARRCGATVIEGRGRGPAAARNLGARHARGELVVFLDADCVPQPGCVDTLLAPLSDSRVVGVRGAYATRQQSLIARFAQLEFDEKQERLASCEQVTVVDTMCAAYRRQEFLGFGGFDERFPSTSAEDVEFSFRVIAAGGVLAYAPGAVVNHRHPEQLGRYLWRKVRFGFFRARLYRRYPARLRADGYTPRLMPVQMTLATLIPITALGMVAHRRMGFALAAVACAFAASSVPLAVRASSKGAMLTFAVPALLLARSLAQSAGLLAGAVAVYLSGSRADLSEPCWPPGAQLVDVEPTAHR